MLESSSSGNEKIFPSVVQRSVVQRVGIVIKESCCLTSDGIYLEKIPALIAHTLSSLFATSTGATEQVCERREEREKRKKKEKKRKKADAWLLHSLNQIFNSQPSPVRPNFLPPMTSMSVIVISVRYAYFV
jgi:hypothetical protein